MLSRQIKYITVHSASLTPGCFSSVSHFSGPLCFWESPPHDVLLCISPRSEEKRRGHTKWLPKCTVAIGIGRARGQMIYGSESSRLTEVLCAGQRKQCYCNKFCYNSILLTRVSVRVSNILRYVPLLLDMMVWKWKAAMFVLTALGQHALLRLLQLLGALRGIGLQHPLTRSYAPPTRHAALAPVGPGRHHARDGICRGVRTQADKQTLINSWSCCLVLRFMW